MDADLDLSGTPCVGSSQRGKLLGKDDESSNPQLVHFFGQSFAMRILENVTTGQIREITEQCLQQTGCAYQSCVTHPSEPLCVGIILFLSLHGCLPPNMAPDVQ